MEIVAPLIALVLAVMASILVLFPLVRGASLPVDENEASDWSDIGRLRAQRNVELQAIQDIDDEALRENITPDEHRALRASHVRDAALLIREIEGREQVLDEEIERAVQRRRQRASRVSGRKTG